MSFLQGELLLEVELLLSRCRIDLVANSIKLNCKYSFGNCNQNFTLNHIVMITFCHQWDAINYGCPPKLNTLLVQYALNVYMYAKACVLSFAKVPCKFHTLKKVVEFKACWEKKTYVIIDHLFNTYTIVLEIFEIQKFP